MILSHSFLSGTTKTMHKKTQVLKYFLIFLETKMVYQYFCINSLEHNHKLPCFRFLFPNLPWMLFEVFFLASQILVVLHFLCQIKNVHFLDQRMSLMEKVSKKKKMVATFFVELDCLGNDQLELTLNFSFFFAPFAGVMLCTNKLPRVAETLPPVRQIEGGGMAEKQNQI